jgi:hypothetical protein
LHLILASIKGSEMAFTPIGLKVESGAKRIASADDAYAFMMYMQLTFRNRPHWQMAKQALNNAMLSAANILRPRPCFP